MAEGLLREDHGGGLSAKLSGDVVECMMARYSEEPALGSWNVQGLEMVGGLNLESLLGLMERGMEDAVKEYDGFDKKEMSNNLKSWWEATERLRSEYVGDGELAADYLQFAMLTGLRRREITGLRWEDINKRRKAFVITENKSKRPYAVPLTPALEQILLRRQDESRPFQIEEPKRFINQVIAWSDVPSANKLSRAIGVGAK